MKHPNPTATTQPGGTARTLRVTIAYEGEALRVMSREVVSMRTPPSDPLEVQERQTGFWFQVEDDRRNLIYRRVMENPVRFDTETPSDDPQRPLRRQQLARPAGLFFLLVPISARAHTVRIFSSPFDPKRSTEPASEVMAFPVFTDVTGENRPSEPAPGGSGTG